MWRVMLGPWLELIGEERELALVQARARGRDASLKDGRRAAAEARRDRDGSEPWRIPRPADYVSEMLLAAPARWISDWRSRPPARLIADLRVCHFALAWEETRRDRQTLLPVSKNVDTLLGIVREARLAWEHADAEKRAAVLALARAGDQAPGDPRRLAVGHASVRVWRARDEYWLWIMLARARGLCDPC